MALRTKQHPAATPPAHSRVRSEYDHGWDAGFEIGLACGHAGVRTENHNSEHIRHDIKPGVPVVDLQAMAQAAIATNLEERVQTLVLARTLLGNSVHWDEFLDLCKVQPHHRAELTSSAEDRALGNLYTVCQASDLFADTPA